jgi:dTDP-4-amino-4,6-dideoxygalactose transaminase
MSRSTERIPFARPSIGEAERRAALRVLDSGWLTTGPEAAALEEELAELVAAPYAKAVSSATAGLHLALEAMGVAAGDRVAMSPYTFTSTAEVVRYLGADPLFCDIEEESCNLDPDALEKTLDEAESRGERVAAVIPVHVGGYPCAMERITEICRRHEAWLLEDAAHALPVRTGHGYLGTIGDAGVYSFYATKPLTTGEGGMVVTRHAALAERIEVMRLHGIDRDVWDRYRTVGAEWRYDVVAPGFKYNMPDLLAAVGRAQLQRLFEMTERRREIARRYRDGLGTRDYLTLPPDTPEHSWHLFILGLKTERLAIDRDSFVAELAHRGIGTSVHYIPLHTMTYYRTRYGHRPDDFPRALERYRSSLSLPLYPDMQDGDVQAIIEAVLEIGDAHRVLASS